MPATVLKQGIRSFFKLVLMEKSLAYLAKKGLFRSIIYKIAPQPTDYRLNSWRQATRHGLTLQLDLSQYMPWLWYFSAPSDDINYKPLLKLIKAGDVVLDVGANVGLLATLLAQKVGPEGKVLAFEPDPALYKQLTTHKQLNNLNQLHPVNMGLGDENARLPLILNTTGNHGGSFVQQALPVTSASWVEVDIMRLDDYVAANAMPRIDAIKIDVEGFEMKVLTGAQATLQHYHPLLFIELDANNLQRQQCTPAQLIAWLQARGYTCRDALKGTPVTTELAQTVGHGDIICSWLPN